MSPCLSFCCLMLICIWFPHKATELKVKAHGFSTVLMHDTFRVSENTFCGWDYCLGKNIEDYSK